MYPDGMRAQAAIYVRISDDRTGEGLGVARQEEDCRGLLDRLKFQVGEVYVDNDVSASGNRPRPAYRRLLADLEAGRWAAVAVWHTDRLTRSPVELERWIAVVEGLAVPTPVHSVTSGPLDLATVEGRTMARIGTTIARAEVEHKAERQRRQNRQAAQAGQLGGGGNRAYGWDREPYLDESGVRRVKQIINEAEAAVVKEMAERILGGEPLGAVIRDMNRRCVPAATGGEWRAHTVKRMLVSGRVSAQREHQPTSRNVSKRSIAGPIVAPGDGSWEAILTPLQTDQLRAILLDPTRRFTHTTPRRCLLSGGLLRCGGCGSNMCGRPREDGKMRYVCPKVPGATHKCGKLFIVADWADDYVVGMVLAALETPDLFAYRDEKTDTQVAHLDAELQRQKARLRTFAEKVGREEWTQEENDAARRPVVERIVALTAELGQQRKRHAAPLERKNYRELWPEMALDQRRAVLRAVIDSVVLAPGRRGYNRFDASRLRINWLA